MREQRTFCRICPALCGVIVTVDDDDRVVDVRGDRDHPISQGYTCPKGRSLGAFHHSPKRLDQPLVRRGGSLQAVAWDQILDDLGERLKGIVEEYGPSAVGAYLGTGSAFDPAGRRIARKLLQAIGSRSLYTSATVDTPCKPLVSELMSGQPMLIPVVDEVQPGLTLLIGSNPVVSHGHLNAWSNPRTRLRRIVDEGELWVVDPRRTETARLATRHLAPRPGSDHAWLAWLVRELLATADLAELRTRADGVDELQAAVAPYDLARACDETGLEESDLIDLRDAIRRHGRFAGQTGTGTTMSAAANVVEWLLWALHIVTDSYDRPGGAWFNPGYVSGFDRRHRPPSQGRPSPGPASRPELPSRWGEYPCAAMADEIKAGNLRALFVVGANAVTSLPDTVRMTAAFEQLEVLAVADVVRNETTALATHVLSVAGQLERADIPHFIDQMQPAVVAQYTEAVVPPQADRRPMWWVFAKLGQALGHDLLGGIDPDAATDDDAIRPLMVTSANPLEALKAQAGVADVASWHVFGWAEELMPGGRWRLAPPELVAQLAELTPAGSGGLSLIPRRQLRHLNSQMADTGTEDGRGDLPRLLINPADAARFGVADGDVVRVSGNGAEVESVAQLDEGIRPGVVSIPHGFGAPNVNVLTSGLEAVDPLTGMVRLSGVPVELVPA